LAGHLDHAVVHARAVGDVGPDAARMHATGRYPAIGDVQFLTQGFGEAAYRILRGVVAAHARLGEQPEHAGDVDDMPGAAGLQVGQEGLAAMHDAPEVDVHDPVVIIQRVAFDGSSHRHPGVVDDQIHPAVVDHYLVGPLPHGLEIGHI